MYVQTNDGIVSSKYGQFEAQLNANSRPLQYHHHYIHVRSWTRLSHDCCQLDAKANIPQEDPSSLLLCEKLLIPPSSIPVFLFSKNSWFMVHLHAVPSCKVSVYEIFWAQVLHPTGNVNHELEECLNRQVLKEITELLQLSTSYGRIATFSTSLLSRDRL